MRTHPVEVVDLESLATFLTSSPSRNAPKRKVRPLGEGPRIKVNEHFQSKLPWLFFGGDMIEGASTITAIANGHEAAREIDRYLNKTVGTVSR